jgi:two-component system chemotaxis sensor kinase CheA
LGALQAALSAAEAGPAPASESSNELAEDPELLADFVIESREHLSAIEGLMLRLDEEPRNPEALNAAFRSFHTIKGLAGFLALGQIRDAAHEVETLLDQARSGQAILTPELISLVLECADRVSGWVGVIERRLAGETSAVMQPAPNLLEKLRRAAAGDPAAAGRNSAGESNAGETSAGETSAGETNAGETNEDAAAARSAQQSSKSKTLAVKVDTAKLDVLVDMVGELVITQTLVRHDPALSSLGAPKLERNLSQLARITGDLQKTAMSMRLVRLSQLFQKMQRLARDTANKTGKRVEVELTGEETELDRTIVEELADPLMHMIRNALDHGVEAPGEREATGKPAKARVALRAAYQGGYILIEIADDGRGMNRDRILAKAMERGLVTDPSRLTDSDILNLIFEPGFSTAEKVTDLSGRGVGMDVVRRQIQKLRGRVEIESTLGQGTTFRIRLPLTLAIIDGLVIGVGGERYIVPIFMVREMLRPKPGMVTTVEGRHEVAMIRDRLAPVVRLHEIFGIAPAHQTPEEALLVICEAQGRSFAMMVDELVGKQEVVIKNLGALVRNVKGVAGGAILSDGRVGLILDIEGIYQG